MKCKRCIEVRPLLEQSLKQNEECQEIVKRHIKLLDTLKVSIILFAISLSVNIILAVSILWRYI